MPDRFTLPAAGWGLADGLAAGSAVRGGLVAQPQRQRTASWLPGMPVGQMLLAGWPQGHYIVVGSGSHRAVTVSSGDRSRSMDRLIRLI